MKRRQIERVTVTLYRGSSSDTVRRVVTRESFDARDTADGLRLARPAGSPRAQFRTVVSESPTATIDGALAAGVGWIAVNATSWSADTSPAAVAAAIEAADRAAQELLRIARGLFAETRPAV